MADIISRITEQASVCHCRIIRSSKDIGLFVHLNLREYYSYFRNTLARRNYFYSSAFALPPSFSYLPVAYTFSLYECNISSMQAACCFHFWLMQRWQVTCTPLHFLQGMQNLKGHYLHCLQVWFWTNADLFFYFLEEIMHIIFQITLFLLLQFGTKSLISWLLVLSFMPLTSCTYKFSLFLLSLH